MAWTKAQRATAEELMEALRRANREMGPSAIVLPNRFGQVFFQERPPVERFRGKRRRMTRLTAAT